MTFHAAAADDTEPFAAMNITPLIDVLLVLIVMLILTIPIVSHEVPVDLPGTGLPASASTSYRLAITANGALTWNDVPLSDMALATRLAAVRDDPNARLEFAPDAATLYDRVDKVLATIRRAGVTRLGFVGNERYQHY